MRVYEAKLTYEPTLFEVGAKSLSSAEAVYEYMHDVLEEHPMQEVFYVVLLNQKNKPLGRITITSGTVSGTLVHPREVFRPAILASASAIMYGGTCWRETRRMHPRKRPSQTGRGRNCRFSQPPDAQLRGGQPADRGASPGDRQTN
jgi:hypothetical protein